MSQAGIRLKKGFTQKIFKEIEETILNKEEEEVFKKVAERLNASYDEQLEQEKKEVKKPKKKSIILDEDTIDFANQSLLLRAILSNNLAVKETLTEFVRKLIREEWKRLFTTYENLNKEIESRQNKKS